MQLILTMLYVPKKGVEQLLFDGNNINNAGSLAPYEIENSLLSVFSGDDKSVYDFLYVADDFAIATDEQGQLSMYSSIKPSSSTILNVWDELDLIDKQFDFLSYGTNGSSNSNKLMVNSVGFVDANNAVINFEGMFYSAPWDINELGQLVIKLSHNSEVDDLIYSVLATNDQMFYLVDANRSNKPSVMSSSNIVTATVFGLWLMNQ